MERILTKDLFHYIDKTVTVCGWVHTRRDHGKIIFVDLRDRSGLLQVVFTPDQKDVYDRANELRSEWVIGVTGKVVQRPKGLENLEMETGAIELQAKELVVFSKAQTPPFALDTQGREINEELRLRYRYVDLRRERMKNNLVMRSKVILFMRNWLSERGFVEIETPILTKSTPEGARDYVVPSRLYPGKFFALPQSPQQYKQLLMVAGLERYFQIARCFRDEDPRGDRQPEFTQLDMEMSFVTREDVMEITEALCIDLVKSLYPQKIIQEIPFPRLGYQEAMQRYGSDKPDLRRDKNDPNLLSFVWVIDFPLFEEVKEDSGLDFEPSAKRWTFTHNPFSAPKPEHMQWLMSKERIGEILAAQYDLVLNGYEIGSGSIRNYTPETLKKVFEIMGYTEERILKNFGHMLDAFSYGAPPHGGIAPGVDRLIMILQNEPNIREVIPFPKTGDCRDPMMDAPSEVEKGQLDELHLKIENKNR